MDQARALTLCPGCVLFRRPGASQLGCQLGNPCYLWAVRKDGPDGPSLTQGITENCVIGHPILVLGVVPIAPSSAGDAMWCVLLLGRVVWMMAPEPIVLRLYEVHRT